MSLHHANCAETTLAAAITTTGETSITVTSEAGFPAVDFIISIGSEVMLVTNVSTTTWTVTRGYEGSTAATHLNGAAIFHDWSAAEADSTVHGPSSATDAHLAVFDGATGKLLKDGGAVPAAGLPTTGGTMTGNLIMDNMDVTLVKLLTLHGEIDDGNSGTAKTIDWNAGAVHKSTLTDNVTLAFAGYGEDVATGGTPSASSTYSGYSAAAAFDDNTGTKWKSGSVTPQWIQYQFSSAKTILYYRLMKGVNAITNGFLLQGSNNGTDFTTISTVTGTGDLVTSEWKYFTIDSPGSYVYYRLYVNANGALADFYEIEFIESGISNPATPCFLTLKLVQDATGGRVVTWPATVKGTPSINLAANAVSNILFYFDGTNYYVVNGKQFVSATDKILGRSTAGAGDIEEIACTATARSILDDTTTAAVLATIGAAAATTTPVISSGTAAPATTPAKVGDMFIDTTNAKVYVAKGTASSADWVILN